MEAATLDVEDDVYFADLSKQISLLIMDEDEHLSVTQQHSAPLQVLFSSSLHCYIDVICLFLAPTAMSIHIELIQWVITHSITLERFSYLDFMLVRFAISSQKSFAAKICKVYYGRRIHMIRPNCSVLHSFFSIFGRMFKPTLMQSFSIPICELCLNIAPLNLQILL